MSAMTTAASSAMTCPPVLEPTSVASWLLVVDRPRQRAVRGVLAAMTGVEYRTTVGGHLVIVSESPACEVEHVHEQLRAIPNVKEVSLVSVFEDGPTES